MNKSNLILAAAFCSFAIACSIGLTELQAANANTGSFLSFTKNTGQWDDQVLFRSNTMDATVWITRDGVVYQFTRPKDSANPKQSPDPRATVDGERVGEIEQLVIKASLVNVNSDVQTEGEDLMPHRANYFLGNDRSHWRTNVPSYGSVTVKNVYDGIDIRYSSTPSGELSCDFMVSPTADVAQIRITYEGAEQTKIEDDGRIRAMTKWGEFAEVLGSSHRRVVSGVKPNCLESAMDVNENSSTSGFVYSTFLGGTNWDEGASIAVDRDGNAYVTGNTHSVDFPEAGQVQSYSGTYDVFVTKLAPSGNSLVYSTYLGGVRFENGLGIAVDSAGCAYITGWTQSDDFPIQNAFQPVTSGDYEAFVAKLSDTGDSLIYSSYFGGSKIDYFAGIAVNESGEAYMTGYTGSSDFPIQSPFQTDLGNDGDAIITKLSNTGSTLVYSSYLGGSNTDRAECIAIDESGCAYVSGWTQSPDFPLNSAYQGSLAGGYNDAFVAKVNATGTGLEYSTFIGGNSEDWIYAIAVDVNHNAYITGMTESSNFPTVNAFQYNKGYSDAFVTKLSSTGNSLVYSTYLGWGDLEYGYGIAVDVSGSAYVIGRTTSPGFPTKRPVQQYQGDWDAFVTKLSTAGDKLKFSTFLGGSGEDRGSAIALDVEGNIFVTGYTPSSNFPVQNPYQASTLTYDAFVAKLAALQYICGDTDGNSIVSVSDAVFLISYIFAGGAAPDPMISADVDCNSLTDMSDAVYLINYIFAGGTAPCAYCP